MLEINEQYVKKVLSRRTELLDDIHNRIIAIHNEIITEDNLIESVSLKKCAFNSPGSSSGMKQDLTKAVLLHERLSREREIESRVAIYQLTEEEESINRIMVCYNSLRGKPRDYLEQLYVKKQPYKAVELESGVSHKTFERYRQKGIREILRLYKSNFSNLKIATLKASEQSLPIEKRKESYNQLKLNL